MFLKIDFTALLLSGSPTKGVVSVVVDSRNEGPNVFAVKEEHIVGRGTSITCGGVTVTSINVTHDEAQEFPQNGNNFIHFSSLLPEPIHGKM